MIDAIWKKVDGQPLENQTQSQQQALGRETDAMLVYRIERDGEGPFRQLGSWTMHEAMGLPNADDSYHSQFDNPYTEGLNMTRDHKCGCANPRQFVEWFPRRLRQYLLDEGFEILVLDIPDHLVQVGEQQVIYLETQP